MHKKESILTLFILLTSKLCINNTNKIDTCPIWLFKLKLIIIKLKSSCTVILAPFQVFSSYMWLGATVSGNKGEERFHHHRKVYCIDCTRENLGFNMAFYIKCIFI